MVQDVLKAHNMSWPRPVLEVALRQRKSAQAGAASLCRITARPVQGIYRRCADSGQVAGSFNSQSFAQVNSISLKRLPESVDSPTHTP